MRIAKIAEIAIVAKIFPHVADSHRTVFNFGNYPILAILAIWPQSAPLGSLSVTISFPIWKRENLLASLSNQI